MIKVGDKVPFDVNLWYSPYNPDNYDIKVCGSPVKTTTGDLLKNKRVVLFALPAAFSPTCQNTHLPGYLKQYDALKAKGINTIICLSTNDAYAMDAWGKNQGVKDKILMVADGNGEFVDKLGLSWDLSSHGLGKGRSKRFAMVIDDGVVKFLGVEPDTGVSVSGVDSVLSKL
ncbi:thioredoxin-like protein [Paraphysoderma sedebokerense]|nr:thioredoxin-like protein [Paraphysoderma sedebokerense]